MKCPFCSAEDTKVIDSRPAECTIRRRRQCEKCGKLIHLECDFVSELQVHVQSEHGFTIDPLRTVFYGVCKECAAAEADKKNEKRKNNE